MQLRNLLSMSLPHRTLAVVFSLAIGLPLVGVGLASDEADAPDWRCITEHAAWRPRDSQGEVVFRDRIWLLGGWFNSESPPPRDVWSSADGKSWQQISDVAPWRHSDLPMTTVFDGKMWIMGGWRNGRLPDASGSNEVWSSSDGVEWQQTAAHADWSPRLGAGTVVFRNKMWILGGSEQYYYGDARSLKNDVWSSSDGRKWTQVVAAAPWAPRAFHQAIVLNNKIYVMGGGNYSPSYTAYNDVWSSEDGLHWDQVTAAASWAPRIWFSSVVYRDRMWVLGGWSNDPSRNWGDVWYSVDGKQWTELKTRTRWKERHEHSAYVFDDKIWIVGGMVWPLVNDVWSISIPENWFEQR
jgi:hypothetical protein